MPSSELQLAQSTFFKLAAFGTVLGNYGRMKLGKEIRKNISKGSRADPEHEEAYNWLGYRPNAFTAYYGFNQGYFYYFGMSLFYWHMAKKRGRLSAIEVAGIINQLVFHGYSMYEFRGLSQKVSMVFMLLVALGAVCQQLAP